MGRREGAEETKYVGYGVRLLRMRHLAGQDDRFCHKSHSCVTWNRWCQSNCSERSPGGGFDQLPSYAHREEGERERERERRERERERERGGEGGKVSPQFFWRGLGYLVSCS